MPKKKIQYSPELPVHIYARCINKEWFSLPMPLVWKIFTSYLDFISHAFNIEIISFVLMNNHFHLIIVAPDLNIPQAMNYFIREVSRAITLECGRINQTFGGPYKPSIIDNDYYLLNVYKYVMQNPLQARIVLRVEDYKYSTLRGVLGYDKLLVPVVNRFEELLPIIKDTDRVLTWLNEVNSEEINVSIKKGLNRSRFKINKSRKTRRIITQ